jgi:2-polyprenyl-6-hydroxyphenyl methylase / 3-demethylubiquinone-9 3-methyltransferase
MVVGAFVAAVAAQGLALLADEVCHRRRGLPRWERIGHPIDTASVAACLVWLLAMPPGDTAAVPGYVALAALSCLLVTKDEAVHARECTAREHWLHAVLFVLHPIVLGAAALAWWHGHTALVAVQLAITLGVLGYQAVYWNAIAAPSPPRPPKQIDNAWYAELGAGWYTARDTPIALLRAEARHRNPWIAAEIRRCLPGVAAPRVLDLGCGGGLLANDLAAAGFPTTGVDTTAENLAVARHHDRTGAATYVRADACALPFTAASFDVVCAMDLIEHVEDPARLIAEASRVLAPGGIFFFHTFNRTWQANLIVIKGVAWFVRNAPPDLHVLRLFRTPAEVAAMLGAAGLAPAVMHGSRPRFGWPLWRMVLTGEVGDDVAFTFTRSTKLGYTGYARKPDY